MHRDLARSSCQCNRCYSKQSKQCAVKSDEKRRRGGKGDKTRGRQEGAASLGSDNK